MSLQWIGDWQIQCPDSSGPNPWGSWENCCRLLQQGLDQNLETLSIFNYCWLLDEGVGQARVAKQDDRFHVPWGKVIARIVAIMIAVPLIQYWFMSWWWSAPWCSYVLAGFAKISRGIKYCQVLGVWPRPSQLWGWQKVRIRIQKDDADHCDGLLYC